MLSFKVEAELAKWECGKYTHITRAVQVLDAKIINLETIFSRPAQDCPVPVAVVFVYFFLDTVTGALTYQFEELACCLAIFRHGVLRRAMGALKLVPLLALQAQVAARNGESSEDERWFSCSAEAWFDEPSRSVRVSLWACRWFDTSGPGALSRPGFGQVAAKIPAEACADGTWSDEASVWLQRDGLVHQQKYVGACLPEEELPRRRDPPWLPKQRPVPERAPNDQDNSPGWSAPSGSPSSGIPPLDLSAPMRYGPKAAGIIRSIDEELAAKIDAPEDERKRIMRKYLMRWHPDKNQEESKETTTAVIQHLYARKAWFVEGAPAHEENVQHEVGGQSLAPGMYERWLDRIIGDKLQVRQLHDLATSFEQTRLVPPPMHVEEEVLGQSVDHQEVSGTKGIIESSQEGEVVAKPTAEREKLDLSTLLANIFDAADEENEFELRHKEVADLLYATPLSLTDWDIKLLLTTATEFETGRIEYKPFVQAAPEIIGALRQRRAAFEERRRTAPEETPVTMEAIELCFGEEIEEVARTMREAFGQVDPAGQGTLSRHEFRTCLMSKLERLSLQEVQMLMQMCREDEQGNVLYEEFPMLLQRLRIDALHNALVETDVGMLRMHLILLARRLSLPSDNIMPAATLRIHIILSIVHPDEHGDVEFGYFLRVCCTVIPWMFDTSAFAEKAATIAKEKADALAKQELEELQGLSSSLANKKRGMDEEDQEDQQQNAPDRDAVEKSLIHVGTQADDKHRNPPTLEVRRFLEAMKQESEKCQLSEAELRGFVAEAEIDQRGEVAYVDHIKTWTPILFELRKSRIYDGILAKVTPLP
ncbi:hypothetical protein AK812_SmicGene6273 [Symbiodinium microadriaticum]|uniref:EF-hand domain-containing protein n=1 Tax=Symbiodinium microadriaticum TaxID=2951 RepID=A0A1Q9ERM2_SYMMI|nr:hypothetical protein AK812_SmicGene6273 [Symbiodinium microadriaticum]